MPATINQGDAMNPDIRWKQRFSNNLLSHTYDQTVFGEAVEAIASRYLPAMASLHAFLVAEGAK